MAACRSLYTPQVRVSPLAKPFLKWAGGKRQMLPELLKHVPAEYGRYFEPFVGGGALFFALQPKRAVLNDLNTRLARTFIAVRDDVGEVVTILRSYEREYADARIHKTDRAFFETVRKMPVDSARVDSLVAGWMIFLNKTCFNGLYRVNRAGQFNVPHGKWKTMPLICDADNLRDASAALDGITIRSGDYRLACGGAREGDLVYFDPPYLPVSETSDFTTYTPGGFGIDQHVGLRDTALMLKERGVHVILSNAGSDTIRGLYSDPAFTIHEVQGKRAINSKVEGRGAVGEFIIT